MRARCTSPPAAQIIDKMTQTELKGISFRPLEVTLKDTFEYFLAVNYCVPGNGSRAQLRKVRVHARAPRTAPPSAARASRPHRAPAGLNGNGVSRRARARSRCRAHRTQRRSTA